MPSGPASSSATDREAVLAALPGEAAFAARVWKETVVLIYDTDKGEESILDYLLAGLWASVRAWLCRAPTLEPRIEGEPEEEQRRPNSLIL
jgi:hypothetical protein